MKNALFLSLSVLISLSGLSIPDKEISAEENTYQLVCTPEMYDMAQMWVHDYTKANQQLEMLVVSSEPGNFAANLNANPSIGLMAGRPEQFANLNNSWNMIIGRDVWVPVINIKNPVIDRLNVQGITQAKLTGLYSMTTPMEWGQLTGNPGRSPVSVYSLPDASPGLKKFLTLEPEKTGSIVMTSEKQLLSAIQNDINGIGFCRLTSLINPGTGEWLDNIAILPIDRNNNGKIDYFENIYTTPADLSRAIWIGKYPDELITNLYVIIPDQMLSRSSSGIIYWILTDGQKSLATTGYCELVYGERQSKLEKLQMNAAIVESSDKDYAGLTTLLFVLLIVVGGGVVIFGIVRSTGRKKTSLENAPGLRSKVINEQNIKLPAGLYFDKTHTWAFMENNGIVKVGINDFLQHITGPFTRVKFKAPGENIKKNEPILSLVQDGKHLDIYAPVSGTIRFINESLVTDPSLINSSPYEAGWLYQIEPSNWLREIQFMKMAKQYQDWLNFEFSRLKDFLATTVNVRNIGQPIVAFQDGGELIDHVLKDMSPQVWEEFQKNFMDTSQLK